MTRPQVWCAIPVYNNAATVKDIATRARAQLDHILVIDDGSTDADLQQLFRHIGEGEALGNANVPVGTFVGAEPCLRPNSLPGNQGGHRGPPLQEKAHEDIPLPISQSDAQAPSRVRSEAEPRIPSHTTPPSPPPITLLRHPVNRGKGAALLTAMQYAHDHGADYLITLDADGQHFPEDIPRFLPHLRPDTILLGHRADVTGDMPGSSRFGREFSDFWIHTETGRQVLDSQSGFRTYPLPASLQLPVRSSRYGFEVEILTRALWSGLQVASVPIRVHYPPRSQRISSFHPLRDNTRLTALHARLIARQLLPVPHRQIQVRCGAAKHAEELATLPRDTGFQPVPSDVEHKESQITKESPPLPLTPSPTPPLSSRPSCLRAFVVKNPFSAALSAALTTFFSIVLYPWGFIPVLYLALRLHLSKLTAFLFLILCLPTFIPTLSQKIGHALLHLGSHPNLERFIGSHLIAFPACLAAGAITYTVAKKLYRKSPQ